MKTKLPLLPALAVIGLLFTSGCASFDSRVEEKAYVFDALSPETKQRLKEGEIRPGDSFDMVYIALGAPNEKSQVVTANGSETIWTYSRFDRRYEGESLVGYQRVVTREGLLGGYRVSYVPVSESVYTESDDERFRVTFANGQVTAIETNT